MLIGRPVCAVVYANEIQWMPEASATSLKGMNLGLVAFTVAGVTDGDAASPSMVNVEVLDAGRACSGAISLMNDAPDAGSSPN